MNNRCTYSRTVRVRRTERVARRRSTSRANEVVYQCARCTSSFQCVCASQSDARTHTHARSHTSTHVYSVTLHRVLFYFFFFAVVVLRLFSHVLPRCAREQKRPLLHGCIPDTDAYTLSLSLSHTHTHTHWMCIYRGRFSEKKTEGRGLVSSMRMREGG